MAVRAILLSLAIVSSAAIVISDARAVDACKICSDQQRACMKNYAGPTCKTEFQMCMKSCKPPKK